MDMQNVINVSQAFTGITGLFSACGSFGIVDGKDDDIRRISPTKTGYSAQYEAFCATCDFREYGNGVYLRTDSLAAQSDFVLNRYLSRFWLEGGEYEVYTQYSSWQNECRGGWQDLITSIEVSNLGIRSTEGGVPMMAIRNKGNGRILVLHLVPNAQWVIRATRCPMGNKNDCIVLEAGFNDKCLAMGIQAGEVLEMGKLYVYETTNAFDLDAWRLHEALLEDYPRKALPVIYNSWLCNFDNISMELIQQQADTAAELGVEYFLIDAGWFGDRCSWEDSIGQWTEQPDGHLNGQLEKVSQYIRSKGLKFGMWLEPERALTNVDAYKAHPEYYLLGNGGNAFLNFANDEARAYIFQLICGLIDRYHVSYMKFDFNAPLAFDETGNGFYRYVAGQRKLIAQLRERYPQLYLTNCASGGNRMDIGQLGCFDSLWYSDNQSPVEGIRMIKDIAKHYPPCALERWDVRRFCGGFPEYKNENPVTLALSCSNATWDGIVAVKPSFTHGFLTGGVIGFSANIAQYPAEEKAALKQLIASYKEDREFYKHAVMRVLHDGNRITVLQYSDPALNRIEIQVFCTELFQNKLTVYPAVDEAAAYTIDGVSVDGKTLLKKGIQMDVSDYRCIPISLKKNA